MSTQDGSGIPFETCNEQQNLRLLELPPSLLELITSQRLSNLELKSAAPEASGGSAQAPPNAVLCTKQNTYQIRQVQSSNSVFILQPSNSNGACDNDVVHGTSMSAIAQCPVTLELVPASPPSTEFLKRSLPVYSGLDHISDSNSPSLMSRKTLLESAPFSLGEFNKAWKNLCIFELKEQPWLPTASSLVRTWESMTLAATLRNMTLGDGFSLATLDGVIEEDGHPSALVRAVIDRLSLENEDPMDGYVVLDRDKTVFWVGMIFLESQPASADGVLLSEFIQGWQNQLPEGWRKQADLCVLEGIYFRKSEDRIVYIAVAGETANANDTTTAKANGKNARKWHEKFKNARR